MGNCKFCYVLRNGKLHYPWWRCTISTLLQCLVDHPGQTKEEEDLPPPGHRRGKRRVVVKSKTAAKMANFKTVCSYFKV